MRKTAIFGLSALAALMFACASGGTTSSSAGGTTQTGVPEQSTTTTTAKVGQTVTLTNNGLGQKTTVEVTVASAKQYTKEPGDFGSTPEHGVFLVLDVT